MISNQQLKVSEAAEEEGGEAAEEEGGEAAEEEGGEAADDSAPAADSDDDSGCSTGTPAPFAGQQMAPVFL